MKLRINPRLAQLRGDRNRFQVVETLRSIVLDRDLDLNLSLACYLSKLLYRFKRLSAPLEYLFYKKAEFCKGFQICSCLFIGKNNPSFFKEVIFKLLNKSLVAVQLSRPSNKKTAETNGSIYLNLFLYLASSFLFYFQFSCFPLASF